MSFPEARYSPMTCLPPLQLTPSGLPQLDTADGEVELLCRPSDMELRSDPNRPMPKPTSMPTSSGWDSRDGGLSVSLTTHRLILVPSVSDDDDDDDDDGRGMAALATLGGRFVHLSMIATAEATGGPSFTSPMATYKILLRTHAYGEVYLVFRTSNASSDRDDFAKSLDRALHRRAWEESARAAEKKKNSSVEVLAGRKVGVDAILTRNKLKHKEAERLTDDVFAKGGDVEKVMGEAGELVAIINKYVATLDRTTANQAQNDQEAADNARLTGMLADMGMTSALSQSQATGGGSGGKAAYYQTVARQLSDFLRYNNKIKDAGGMMTLTDVYCLFNRARGTNLISPDDLLMALPWMEKLSLGLKKREFDSGVVVVQDDSFDDVKMAEKLVEIADTKAGDGMTVLDASRLLKVSAMLANEQLLAAEKLGRLCRDVTLEGTRFYRNRFVEDAGFGEWSRR
jgi:ESCRT-II complex subunit VPS36